MTLVEFEGDLGKGANAPSSVDTEDAEDSVRSALKSRYMLDVESFQNAMFKFLLPPQPGDGQLVRHVFSIFSMPALEVDEDGKLSSQQEDGTEFEGAQLGVATKVGFLWCAGRSTATGVRAYRRFRPWLCSVQQSRVLQHIAAHWSAPHLIA